MVSASTFRSPAFGDVYGTRMTDGPLAGLMARAVVIIDERGKIVYTQLVDEISQEPDYAPALAAVTAAEPLPACTTAFSAEHSRGTEDDGPCDDGRAGG